MDSYALGESLISWFFYLLAMNGRRVWWFSLLLAGVMLLVYGVIVAASTFRSCGVGPSCAGYSILGVDPWAVALGYTDLGTLLVVLSLNRLTRPATTALETYPDGASTRG